MLIIKELSAQFLLCEVTVFAFLVNLLGRYFEALKEELFIWWVGMEDSFSVNIFLYILNFEPYKLTMLKYF